VSSSTIDLSWVDTNNKETGYAVERSLGASTGFAVIVTVGNNQQAYRDTALAPTTTYYYRVRALGRRGSTSPYSNVASATTLPAPDTTAPSVPTGLTAMPASCSQIDLSWNPSTDGGGSGLLGYRVYRDNTFLKQVLAPLTSTSDTGLAPSTAHGYTVSAIDNAGMESARSSGATAATPACPTTSTTTTTPTTTSSSTTSANFRFTA